MPELNEGNSEFGYGMTEAHIAGSLQPGGHVTVKERGLAGGKEFLLTAGFFIWKESFLDK